MPQILPIGYMAPVGGGDDEVTHGTGAPNYTPAVTGPFLYMDDGDDTVVYVWDRGVWNSEFVNRSTEDPWDHLTSMSGILHAWKLDETSGTAADSVSAGGLLTLSASGSGITRGQATNSNGLFVSQAKIMTIGGSGWLESSTSPGLGGSSSRTVMMMVRSSYNSEQGPFGWGATSGCAWFQLSINTSSTYNFWGWDTCDFTSFGTGIADGAWHLLAVTYDGSAVRIYKDGSQQGSASKSLNTGSGNLTIGRGRSTNWVGDIAFPALFNRVLTTQEQTDMYNIALNGFSD